MEKRLKSIRQEIGGRTWEFRKQDAFTSVYVALKIFTKILPLGDLFGLTAPGQKGSQDLTKEEFTQLMKDVLRSVFEIKTVNDTPLPVPVINDSGMWGVEDVCDDAVLVMSLLLTALRFNLGPFFDERAGEILVKALQSTN